MLPRTDNLARQGEREVRVISRKKLREFWTVHADAEEQLLAWYRVVKKARWRRFADVRAVYGRTVDRIGECFVFNIHGNRYRLVANISYDWTVVLTCTVLTHEEYDRVNWKETCRCSS